MELYLDSSCDDYFAGREKVVGAKSSGDDHYESTHYSVKSSSMYCSSEITRSFRLERGEKDSLSTEEYLLERVFFELNFQAGNAVAVRPGVVVAYAENASSNAPTPSQNADDSLRLHAPSLSVMPQRKRGRKKCKNKMSYLYVKWNSFAWW
jgi:hypothetical protein